MNQIFYPADILLPKKEIDMQKWAVIACDQFTSEPEYWERIKAFAGEEPSTVNYILPEAELGDENVHRIDWIHYSMEHDLKENNFDEYSESLVYVEREMKDGSLRKGIVGMIDLEEYDYSGHSESRIRATEETVLERIPPRMSVRKGAALDVSHILLLCEDEKRELIEGMEEIKDQLPLLYDFDLMEEGGHIKGRLIQKEALIKFQNALASYYERQNQKYGEKPVYFLLGDGNHSLACAKDLYEEWKTAHPTEDTGGLPLRYALVELNNIYAYEAEFEPIHRLVKNVDPVHLLETISSKQDETAVPIQWVTRKKEGTLFVNGETGGIPLGLLQPLLDAYVEENGGEIDYIHDLDALKKVTDEDHEIGLILPAIQKEQFFYNICRYGVYPRKTFSIGEAREKRYYIECRKLR